MNVHLKFKTWHLDVSFHQRQPVLGVNSKLDGDHHFLMWDFDKVDLHVVLADLTRLQSAYNLPIIYLIQSSVEGNYHAYCLDRCSWTRACINLMDTPNLDQQYYKLGIMRGYFTLRFTDKHDSKIETVWSLASHCPESVSWAEMQNFERYFTVRRKHGK